MRFIYLTYLLGICLLCAPATALSFLPAQQIKGTAISEALQQVYGMLKDKKVNDITLREDLIAPSPPLQMRNPEATIRFSTEMPVDTLLAEPSVNINVFLEGKEHLSAELWKLYFEQENDQWHPTHFKAILRADIGDQFSPHQTEVYKFKELTIKKDAIEFHISDGYLVPASAQGYIGRVAIFGKGQFVFQAIDNVEQQQLNKYAKNDGHTYSGAFTQMALIISPQGYNDLIDGVDLQPVNHNRIYNRAKTLLNRVEKDYMMQVKPLKKKWSFLPTSREYLTAEFDIKSSRNWLVYSYNPYDQEEIKLVQKTGFPRNAKLKPPVIWCHFPGTARSNDKTTETDTPSTLYIKNYTIRGKLETNKKTLRLKTEVHLQAQQDSITFATFNLNDKLTVRRVDYEDGQAALVIHQGSFLSVPLLKPLQKGEKTTLTFYYDGDIVQQPSTTFYTPIKNEEWLPRHSSRDIFQFDLEMQVPKSLTTISAGVKTDEHVENNIRTSKWYSPRPINLFGITFTEHRTISSNLNGIDITVYVEKNLTKSVSRERDILEHVDDVLPFYNEVFGTYPYKKLDIVQMADASELGQGYPSLLMLWGLYFRSDNILDRNLSANQFYNVQQFFKGFLAHELAHQWWGNVVIPETYRDYWLAEGMATYAADLYIEKEIGEDQFIDMLRNHTEQALSADKEGAISLGFRLRKHYQPVVYDKGALILHMLRKICGDEKFFTMLSTFYQRSAQQLVGTADFKKVVEDVMEEDMAWFFNQWVYSTGYPKYRLTYTSEKQEDGQYRIRGTLTQKQTGHIFKMPVPVRVELKNGERVEIIVWSDSLFQSFEVIATDEVDHIEVAPDYSVYCETETE